jgi:hypothetical protein
MRHSAKCVETAQETIELTTTRLWNLKHSVEYSEKSHRQIGSIISKLDATYRQLDDCRLQLTELGAGE